MAESVSLICDAVGDILSLSVQTPFPQFAIIEHFFKMSSRFPTQQGWQTSGLGYEEVERRAGWRPYCQVPPMVPAWDSELPLALQQVHPSLWLTASASSENKTASLLSNTQLAKRFCSPLPDCSQTQSYEIFLPQKLSIEGRTLIFECFPA